MKPDNAAGDIHRVGCPCEPRKLCDRPDLQIICVEWNHLFHPHHLLRCEATQQIVIDDIHQKRVF
jgi:hypothetical protein